MKVCVVGLGYIGFPTACTIASAGHEVLGVDTKAEIVDALVSGSLHITNEPGLDDLATTARESGNLRFGLLPEDADVFIIAVPTPFRADPSADNGHINPLGIHADLTYVASAVQSVATYVRPGNIVVLESTVPPGTTRELVAGILEQQGVDPGSVLLVHAPERVIPGNIVEELRRNDRIIGGLTPEAGRAAAEFYETFVEGKVVMTDATTAELVKLMENTFRDVNIALANEFAKVCEQLGSNIWEAIALANRHPRVKFLRPGPGVGGHCIAVDPYFVAEAAPALTPLIQAARAVNSSMPRGVVSMVESLKDRHGIQRIVCLGAAYKANVGDDRESPALEISELLKDRGFDVRVHDPYIARYASDLDTLFDGADLVLLLTDHDDYSALDPRKVAVSMAKQVLLDTRGAADLAAWESAGFAIARLGVGSKVASVVPA